MVTVISVTAPRDRRSNYGPTRIPTQEPRMQEPCTISFVETSHDSPFPLPPASPSLSLVSVFWLGLALVFTSHCSPPTSDHHGTTLDWTLLASLAFQLFFFWDVVWRALHGFLCRQQGHVSRFWTWCRTCFLVWLGIWSANWGWTWGWSFGRWSITRPWKHGNSASSFRRLG